MRITKDFITAGNATFTIETPDAEHMTFRVRRVEPTERFPKPAYFVSTLIGPCNETNYIYVGKLDDFTGQVSTTAKSEQWRDTFRFRLLNRILCRVWGGEHAAFESYGYRLMHCGKCGRCGRKLTVPSSIDSGIGPECARQMGVAA